MKIIISITKKIKRITAFIVFIGFCIASCNTDNISPLGTEGEDIDPPLEVDSTSTASPVNLGT